MPFGHGQDPGDVVIARQVIGGDFDARLARLARGTREGRLQAG
jgi:hypothetical protein